MLFRSRLSHLGSHRRPQAHSSFERPHAGGRHGRRFGASYALREHGRSHYAPDDPARRARRPRQYVLSYLPWHQLTKFHAAQAALFTTFTRAIYSLSPSPLPSLSLLTAYALSSIPFSASSKWKPASEGYGTIVHPDGPRKKVVDKKGKGKAVEVPRKASAPAALGKSKVVEKDKPKEKPKERAMGERRGLFARPAEPVLVPKKRKASPPPAKKKVIEKVVEKPKKKVSNGIFDDEVSEDEEEDEEQVMSEIWAETSAVE